MKNLILPFKTGLVAILLTGLGQFVYAATYTASVSGNWSSSATWGGTAPGANISGADNLIINSGVTVTLDENVTLNNASASLAVAGALTGTSNLTINGGTLTGAGTVNINTLTIGAGGAIASTGTITVNQLANNSTLLTLLATVNITDSVELNAGMLELGVGGIANLSSNITLVMAGGSFAAGTGTLNLGGSYNLYYTGTVSGIGPEASLTGLQNVTVNLSSSSGQLALSGNLTVAGNLLVQQGSLSTGAYTLTINGSITTSVSGSIMGSPGTNIVLNGSGSLDTLNFATGGQTVNNVTVNIGSGGSVALGSNLTVAGSLALNNGSLALNGNTLNLGGTISATANGGISGSAGSGINVAGTGNAGTLSFTATGDTLGNLSINIASGGSISLGSGLVIAGTLSLNNSSLSLNGQNLTVNGNISTTGSGSVSGSASSNITFSGSGSTGTLVLTAGSQTINNLNINIGSSGNVSLGSAITVGGTLNLVAGTVTIDSTDLTIGGSGSISGGSSSSYVITAGSGSLVMTVANGGAADTFQVGTQANFAPVVVTNNSSSSGNFMVNAQAGVFANGTSGTNLALSQSVVNTSWNVESSIATGANVNLQMTWNTSMQVNGFDNTHAYISHYTGGAWNTQTPVAATVDGNGNYSLSLNGVTSFSPFAVFDKNTTTAITDVKAAEVLQLYPNPATNQINVLFPASLPYYDIRVYDALGNQLMYREGQSGLMNFDISHFAPGVYFLSVNNNLTQRFIKQ